MICVNVIKQYHNIIPSFWSISEDKVNMKYEVLTVEKLEQAKLWHCFDRQIKHDSLFLFRMPGERVEERTLEVSKVPVGVDEELLSLYFENKRRSGGGPLVSVVKDGDRAIVVFEDAAGKSL